MSEWRPDHPIYVDTPAILANAVTAWQAAPALAVDTEANSLHSYTERTSLIQVSTRDQDYIVDPIALTDLDAFGALLADPTIEKVLHAAENDILALKRDYGFAAHNVFDTMLASRILGLPRVGLGDLIRENFGVSLDKRMQRYDWSTRPLDPAALAYATEDTHYLLDLRDHLYQQLVAADRWEEARQEFERLGRAEPVQRVFDPDAFWRVKGAHDILPRERAVLRELYRFRDDQARQLDRPPFKVLADASLVELSRAQPQSSDDLRRLTHLSHYQARKYGPAILAAVRAGQGAPIPYRPRDNDRPDDATLERFEALRAWRKATAAERGIEPDVLLSNAALWTLARRLPATVDEIAAHDIMTDYKLRRYGESLLALLHTAPNEQTPPAPGAPN